MSLTARFDALVERGADALESWARDLAVDGGFKRQVAEELLDDAAFLRKLTPTKIAARARGESPTEAPPRDSGATMVSPPLRVEADATQVAGIPPVETAPPPAAQPTPPPGPEPRPTPKPRVNLERPSRRRGPNPFVVIGIAFVAGMAVAKLVDWRGHAHPKR